METGIGADAVLYTPADRRRVHRTLKVFLHYTAQNQLKEPWLDVGAGESFMRDLLLKETGLKIQTSEVDLDVTPYEFDDNTFQTITSFEVLEHLFNPLF